MNRPEGMADLRRNKGTGLVETGTGGEPEAAAPSDEAHSQTVRHDCRLPHTIVEVLLSARTLRGRPSRGVG